jgi:integrase
MGRRAQGPSYRKVGGIWTVRFSHGGRQHEYSTGIKAEPKQRRPSQAAIDAGQQIYAATIQGKRVIRAGEGPRAPKGTGATLAESFAAWLQDLTVREPTRDVYEDFTVLWLREWRRASELTEASVAAYFRKRLREVVRKSAANEASALRRFSAWAVETGELDTPIVVPSIPKEALGTRSTQRSRTRAPDLSEAEIEAVLAALPERSDPEGNAKGAARGGTGFPIRARFLVMWETSLRPATLDKLSVPEHWAPGERTLRITAEIDKEGAAREVPLSARALKALKAVAPKAGPIFGVHDYVDYIRPAAAAALPPAKAAIFTGQHFRSAAITRALERSSNLAGVMHLAGHRHAATTSKYVRPTLRAAEAVIEALSREESREKRPRRKAKTA